MRAAIEAGAALTVLFTAIACSAAALGRHEGAAGAATRWLATLLLPALMLASLHAYLWPLSLAISVALGVWQLRSAQAVALPALPRLSWLWVAGSLALVLVAARAALSIASPPYDFDSVLYHLPMAVATLQSQTIVPAQVMFHPGNEELLLSLGLGAQGAIGGQTLMEAVIAAVLFAGAYALAAEAGAARRIAVLAACAVLAVPMIGDLIFTAENDVLVAALLLAFVALWRRNPVLCALAAGMAAGVKFTGAFEIAFMLPFLWSRRSPALSWWHAALAVAVGAPWYLRNLIETGNPFFLGDQTVGFASSIAGQFAAALPFVLAALRNFGGLVTLLGIVGAVVLSASKRDRTTLAPQLLWLGLAVVVAWFVTPNTAYVHPGTLDAIATGWSVRYALCALAVFTIAAILWLARINVQLAGAVAALSVAFTIVRVCRQLGQIDAGTAAYALPLALAGVAALACFVLRGRGRALAGAAAAAIFAVTSSVGAARIGTMWEGAYRTFGKFDYAVAFASPQVRGASRIATLQILPLPLQGASMQRYVLPDKSGASLQAWWSRFREEDPRVVVAADVPIAPGGMNERERYLRASGLYALVASAGGTRIYVAQP
ncbi:MAG TPA: glycosyltransferase 87 family protein [Verrucomicrobiae bacterium]|nr:glycosyltransferase 87 family protein [Verrucomicrobiae bacterium]